MPRHGAGGCAIFRLIKSGEAEGLGVLGKGPEVASQFQGLGFEVELLAVEFDAGTDQMRIFGKSAVGEGDSAIGDVQPGRLRVGADEGGDFLEAIGALRMQEEFEGAATGEFFEDGVDVGIAFASEGGGLDEVHTLAEPAGVAVEGGEADAEAGQFELHPGGAEGGRDAASGKDPRGENESGRPDCVPLPVGRQPEALSVASWTI